MMTADSPAGTRMMGIAHAVFRRDLIPVRLVLTAAPAPRGDRRQAAAEPGRGRARHQTEDAGLWPLVASSNPAAAWLLEAMKGSQLSR